MEIIIGLIIVAAVLAFIAHHFAVKKAKEETSHGGDPSKCPYLNPNVKSEHIEKNIVETTAPVMGKVISAEIVTQPKETSVATPVQTEVKPKASAKKTTKPKQQQTTKAPTTTAPKKRKPAPKV
jgi:hypothetical protein